MINFVGMRMINKWMPYEKRSYELNKSCQIPVRHRKKIIHSQMIQKTLTNTSTNTYISSLQVKNKSPSSTNQKLQILYSIIIHFLTNQISLVLPNNWKGLLYPAVYQKSCRISLVFSFRSSESFCASVTHDCSLANPPKVLT